jgi:hypothetical protein
VSSDRNAGPKSRLGRECSTAAPPSLAWQQRSGISAFGGQGIKTGQPASPSPRILSTNGEVLFFWATTAEIIVSKTHPTRNHKFYADRTYWWRQSLRPHQSGRIRRISRHDQKTMSARGYTDCDDGSQNRNQLPYTALTFAYAQWCLAMLGAVVRFLFGAKVVWVEMWVAASGEESP